MKDSFENPEPKFKTKTGIEYDFIIDVLVPYQQEGLISNEDVIWLTEWLAAYENSPATKS